MSLLGSLIEKIEQQEEKETLLGGLLEKIDSQPLDKKIALTPDGATKIAQMSPDLAALVAQKDSPSRKDVKQFGITGLNIAERKQFAELLRGATQEVSTVSSEPVTDAAEYERLEEHNKQMAFMRENPELISQRQRAKEDELIQEYFTGLPQPKDSYGKKQRQAFSNLALTQPDKSFWRKSYLAKAKRAKIKKLQEQGLIPDERRKYKGFWDELGRNTVGGGLNVASGLLSTFAGSTAWEPDKLEEWAQKLYEKSGDPAFTAAKEGGWKGFVAASVGQALPYMGASTVSVLVTGMPYAAFGVGFAVEGDNAYRDAIASGASEEDAQMNRFVVGIINGAIEQIQVGQLFKFAKAGKGSMRVIAKAAQDKAMKEIAKKGGKLTLRLVQHAAKEGLEESLQEFTSIAAESRFNPGVWDTATERLLKSGLGGAVVGGLFGVGGAVRGQTSTDVGLPEQSLDEFIQKATEGLPVEPSPEEAIAGREPVEAEEKPEIPTAGAPVVEETAPAEAVKETIERKALPEQVVTEEKQKDTKKEKEIEDEQEAITEPTEGAQVEPEEAGRTVPEPTGKLDPTNAEEALEIVKRHTDWVASEEKRPTVGGIVEMSNVGVITSVEYTADQVDQAYRSVQKEIESPMADTSLFAMPGKEAKLKAVAAKMAKMKKLAGKKKTGVRRPAALPKARTEQKDHIKAVFQASAKEASSYAINGIFVEGDNLVATDGHRMFVAKGEWGKDGVYLDGMALKKGELGKVDKEGLKFPHWQDIIPDVSSRDAIVISDLRKTLRHVVQAALLTNEESRGVVIVANKDGTLGFTAAAPEEGHVEVNVHPGGRILGGVNPRFLIDSIRFHAIRGDTSFEFYFPIPDRPVLTKSSNGKTMTIIMPINLGGTSETIAKEAVDEGPKKSKGKREKAEGFEAGEGFASYDVWSEDTPPFDEQGQTHRDGSNESERAIFSLVDLVEIAKQLTDGKIPAVARQLQKRTAGGMFRDTSGDIGLRADIFIGPTIQSRVVRTGVAESVAAKILDSILKTTGLRESEIHIKIESTKTAGFSRVTLYRIDPDYAAKVLAHEIGHLVDWLDDKSMAKGNILGRIASLKEFMEEQLSAYPGGPGKITAKEKAKMRRIAKKSLQGTLEVEIDEEIRKVTGLEPDDIIKIWNSTIDMRKVTPELYSFIAKLSRAEKKSVIMAAFRGEIPEELQQFAKVEVIKTGRKIKKIIEQEATPENIEKKYRELFEEEARKRQLVERDVVTEELKALSKWWKPFDANRDPAYTKYRFSSPELYADALSVLLNNPAALATKAPTFYRAFFGWLENKPSVEKAYDQIVTEIKSGESLDKAEARLDAGMKEGDKKAAQMWVRKLTPSNIWKALRVGFIRKARLVDVTAEKAIREGVIEPKDSPTERINDAIYGHSEQELYNDEIYNSVLSILADNNLDEYDLSKYIYYLRVINDRSKLANPQGFTAKTAQIQLDKMAERLGPQRYKVLEETRKNFWEIRKALVISKIKEAGMYDQALIDKIESNEFYGKFSVIEYLEKKYGAENSQRLYAQVGTLKDIRGTVDATIDQDLAIMSAINWNTAKRSTINMLIVADPDGIELAEQRWVNNRYEFNQPKDPDKKLIVFLNNGNLEGYYVDHWYSVAFKTGNSKLVEIASTIARATSAPFKLIFVGIKPGFMAFNVMRDFWRAWRNLPKATLRNWTPTWTKSFVDAFKSEYGNPTEVVKEMLKKNLLISGFQFGGLKDAPSTAEKIKDMSRPKEYTAKFINPLWYYNNILRIGAALERIPKIGGYKYLKENFPDMEQDVMAKLIREEVGSPPFLIRGTATWLTNNLFLFSNPMFQGWDSDIKALKNRPAEVLRKLALQSFLPKAIMWTLSSGALIALLKGLGADDDDEIVQWAKSVKKVYDNVGERDMTSYTIVPLGITPEGKSVVLRIPIDETARFFGGLFWKTMQINKKGIKGLQQIGDYTAEQSPGLNPAIDVSLAVLSYITGRNPYDTFRGRNVIPEQLWKAGGLDSHKAFLKYVSNELGGGIIYRFSQSDIEGTKTELEKVLNAPVIGDAISRFLKVTDQGKSEIVREVKQAEQKKRAQILKKVKAIADIQYAGGELTKEQEALAKKEKTYLKKRGKKVSTIKAGDRWATELLFAQTRAEKDAIHLKMLELEGDDFDLTPYIKKDIVSKAQVFARTIPNKIAARRKWKSDLAESVKWLEERNVDVRTMRRLYDYYLRNNIKSSRTRTKRMTKFNMMYRRAKKIK